jgi:hypothetical protein
VAVLALLAEEAETCQGCGYPMSECRDPSTERQWRVETSVCHPGVIIEATQENLAEEKPRRRGLHVYAVRSTT